jgi:hypothetical protein
MNRHRNRQRPPNIAAAITAVNVKVSRWEAIARQRFKAGETADQEAFESHWPQMLTNLFHAETTRVSLALRRLSEGRDN